MVNNDNMSAATKQQLEDELDWRQRIEGKIDRLGDRYADDAQIRANVSYIFQPGSVWEKYATKVESNNTDIVRAKAVIAFLSMATLVGLWQNLKHLLERITSK